MSHHGCVCYPPVVLVLPTKTTCTDAYAAVAAKISTGRAFVKIANAVEKSKEKATTAPSREARL